MTDAALKRVEELEAQIAVMRARLMRLLDASEHSAKMDWMGDDDPWGDAESALTPDTGKREELLLENVRLRKTLLDIALRGDSLPVDATPEEHDAAIIEMRDMANDALAQAIREMKEG